VRDIQRRLLTGDQPMPAERRLKGVAVVVGLEDKEAALCAPIPFVGPVAGPLLEAWAAPRTRRLGGWRGGDLAARRDDGIALLLRDRIGLRGPPASGTGAAMLPSPSSPGVSLKKTPSRPPPPT